MPLDVPQFLGLLAIMIGAAKVFGSLAQWIGQPAVLGELLAGVLLGGSVLGIVDVAATEHPGTVALHLLGEIGVIILLFEIGLETQLSQMLRVGGVAAVVALAGVVVPFALGYVLCLRLGQTPLVSTVAGAALTATSIGITARVLSDLGRLKSRESQVILGAAVLDDVIGLVILSVVYQLTQGQEVTASSIARVCGVAVGFLAITFLIGSWLVPRFLQLAVRYVRVPGTPTMVAVMLVFALAWLAHEAGSAVIIGAFAAGLLLAGTRDAPQVAEGVTHLGHFFVPLFFIYVGAAVDVRVLNPLDPANRPILAFAGLLLVAAVAGKFVAGYAPFWFRGRKSIIGIGMIPRGEVGLIFAQMGWANGVFDGGVYSAITVVVMATTFITPPLLKLLFARTRPPSSPTKPVEGLEDLVTEA